MNGRRLTKPSSQALIKLNHSGQAQQKSSIVKNSLNPEWNEEFVFDVTDEKEALVISTSAWGLKLLLYEALRYSCMRP
jgi:Ca2+-dependent lipid-binding protein